MVRPLNPYKQPFENVEEWHLDRVAPWELPRVLAEMPPDDRAYALTLLDEETLQLAGLAPRTQKYNPNHDERGRFSTSEGGFPSPIPGENQTHAIEERWRQDAADALGVSPSAFSQRRGRLYDLHDDLPGIGDPGYAIEEKTGVQLADAAGIPKGDAYEILSGWHSNGPSDPRSMALARVVGEKFGVPIPSWYKVPEWVQNASPFVTAQYQATQDYYTKQGQTEQALFRGVSLPDEKASSLGLGSLAVGESRDLDLPQYPLSSWTNTPDIAQEFTTGIGTPYINPQGFLLSTTFPVSRIFSNALTGVGSLAEGEHVVIGGPTRVRATRYR